MSRSGERKPLIIDAESLASDGNTEPASPFARATYADLISNSPGRFAGLCDRLHARPEHFGYVVEISNSLQRIETTSDLDSVEAFRTIVMKAGAVLDHNSLEKLAIETISTSLCSKSLDSRLARRRWESRTWAGVAGKFRKRSPLQFGRLERMRSPLRRGLRQQTPTSNSSIFLLHPRLSPTPLHQIRWAKALRP